MRLVMLVALLAPLVVGSLHLVPTADACTPPVCRFQNCEFTFETPKVDPKEMEIDPGLVGVECGSDD